MAWKQMRKRKWETNDRKRVWYEKQMRKENEKQMIEREYGKKNKWEKKMRNKW